MLVVVAVGPGRRPGGRADRRRSSTCAELERAPPRPRRRRPPDCMNMRIHDINAAMGTTVSRGRGQRVRRWRAAAAAPGPPRARARRGLRRRHRPGGRSPTVHPHPASAGRCAGSRRPTSGCSPRPTWSSWRCRTASPPAWWPRRCRAGRPRRRPRVPTSGCATPRRGRPTTAAATPAPGRTACPSCPAPRDAVAASDRVANPGCYADRVDPRARARCWPPGSSTPHDVVVVAASGTSGAGRRATDAAARAARSWVDVRLQGRRHPPAHARDRAVAVAVAGAPVTLSFTPMLAPMPRGILATCTARCRPGVDDGRCVRRCAARGLRDEPFVHVLPEGAWPPHQATCRAATRRTLQVAVDVHAGRAVVTVATRQPRQGRRRPGDPEREPGARPARDAGLAAIGASRRERHRSRRASGPPASRPGSRPRGGRRGAGRQRRAAASRRPACSPATGSRPRRCCGREQVLTDGRLAAVRPQLGRRQRLHRAGRVPGHPSHRRAGRRAARLRRRRGRGLLHRPDR